MSTLQIELEEPEEVITLRAKHLKEGEIFKTTDSRSAIYMMAFFPERIDIPTLKDRTVVALWSSTMHKQGHVFTMDGATAVTRLQQSEALILRESDNQRP